MQILKFRAKVRMSERKNKQLKQKMYFHVVNWIVFSRMGVPST